MKNVDKLSDYFLKVPYDLQPCSVNYFGNTFMSVFAVYAHPFLVVTIYLI